MSTISYLCLNWENQGAGGCGNVVIDGCKDDNAGPECTVVIGQTWCVEYCLLHGFPSEALRKPKPAMLYPVASRPFMIASKPPGLTRIYILGEPQCWIYAVKASGIHVYDRQIMAWYHHTMLLHTDNLHNAWPKRAILVMDQATALFEFLQHISFPQPSHFAFRLICGKNFLAGIPVY